MLEEANAAFAAAAAEAKITIEANLTDVNAKL
jgi:hypothetical protein